MLGLAFIFFSILNRPILAQNQTLSPIEIHIDPLDSTIKSNIIELEQTNIFSIPLDNMESLEDISQNRNFSFFQLSPTPTNKFQFFAKLGEEQKISTKYYFENKKNNSAYLQLGLLRDYRKINYWDNGNTPYNNNDDFISSVNAKKQHYFIESAWKYKQWNFLAAQDYAKKNVLAGKEYLGTKQQNREELDVEYKMQESKITAFGFLRNEKFNSSLLQSPSTSTNSYQAGLRFNTILFDNFLLELLGQQEKLNRSTSYKIKNSFNRNQGNIVLKNFYSVLDWMEIDSIGKFTFSQDEATGSSSHNNLFVDGELNLSSTRKYIFGVEAYGKKYSLLPRPTYIFGDGSLVSANPELPAHKGWRGASGPWLSIPDIAKIAVHAFAEESKDESILLANSPTSAKAYPLNAVWIRGLEYFSDVQLQNWKFSQSYTYQLALNASAINWQYGKPIPGKPQHKVDSSISYLRKQWTHTISHLYRSNETIDLTGNLKKPTQHKLNASIEFHKQLWRVKLEGNHLLAKNVSNLEFSQNSGINLLEPEIEQRSIFLEFEFIL